MAIQVTRTYVASIQNQQQVKSDLDSLGFAVSKLWNIARWTCDRIWSETGIIPEDGPLKAYLKNHERYADLNSQSSQRIIDELAKAFNGWYTKRRNRVLERLLSAISKVSMRMTKLAKPETGATVGTKACTVERSTASRTC